MKRSTNHRGQAAVEASVMAFFLMMVFVFVFYTFLIAVSKMRSLDASFYAGRALQVKESLALTDQVAILGFTFGLKGLLQNPAAGTVQLRYLSPSPFGISLTQTANAYIPPNFSFLKKSWPSAPTDEESEPTEFLKDAAALEILLKAPVPDKVTDLLEETEADSEVSRQ